MENIRSLTDKTAIGLSLLCALHCLAFPFAMVLVPSLAGLSLDGEAFHLWMVIAVIPTSLFALTLGCKHHKRYWVVLTGLVGLLILAMAAIAGAKVLGETGEKSLTLLGATVIALGHYWNFRRCQNNERCQ
ncbi:MerC domain-containing protein [Aestuariirhabdus sp. Z084]|uniref:MerC domain-containing protein n=1 Tax=Aestuariirhabdus haliotis TaxID=2918751 RepID=UPI00201B3C70|nr:MerC domain-containing protein [Aestuariirhabdus haliotis]MCL6417119.1 MerC domain-containing protein [Aestuariirhabdus haliotis]MCL6421069.1 MerC domain-containing protein [Aestuariirhabdus haliotis]